MKNKLLFCLIVFLSACSQAEVQQDNTQQSKVQKKQQGLQKIQSNNQKLRQISGTNFSSNCRVNNESFKDVISTWSISDLIDVSDNISIDIDHDGKDDIISLLQPTEELYDYCKSISSDDVLLLTKSTKLDIASEYKIDIGYASLPKLNKTSNGFSLNYESGQSTKCDNSIEFVLNNNHVYVDNLKTLCYVPDSNIGWQKLSFSNKLVSPNDIEISNNFENLQQVFFETSNYKYTVKKKTSIYSQPSNTYKTSSYFIAGDDVKSLSVNDDWIEVSYSNDTKRGWLSLRDLEKIAVTSSTEESNNKLSKNGFNDIHIDQPFDSKLFKEIPNSSNPDIKGCFFAEAKSYSEDLLKLFVFGNKVSAIHVERPEIESYAGVKVGDSIHTVYEKHNHKIPEIRRNEYSNQPIIIYWNSAERNIGTRYDIEEGKVYSIQVGNYKVLGLQEGCS